MRLAILCSILFSLFSCGSNKSLPKEIRERKALELEARDPGSEVFVVTSDSVKHSGTKFKYSPTYFSTVKYIEIDGTRYPWKKDRDIIAYQNNEVNEVYVRGEDTYALRLIRGKVNLYEYIKSIPDGSTNPRTDSYFLLEKSPFHFIIADFANVDAVFGDNPAVIAVFHQMYPDEVRNRTKFPKQNLIRQEQDWQTNMVQLTKLYNQ